MGSFMPASTMRVIPVMFEHVGAAAESWATAWHDGQVRAQLGGSRCGERGFSMVHRWVHFSCTFPSQMILSGWYGLCCLGKDCSPGSTPFQLPCSSSFFASGQKFSSKIILELPFNGLGWMTHIREARGAEQGREVGMLLKNRLGEMIFFLQILKFLLGNTIQLLGQLKVN